MEELLAHCEHEDADGSIVALDDASRSRILAAGTAMNEEARSPAPVSGGRSQALRPQSSVTR